MPFSLVKQWEWVMVDFLFQQLKKSLLVLLPPKPVFCVTYLKALKLQLSK